MSYTDTTGIVLHLPTPGTREPAAIALLNENFVAIAAHTHATTGVGALRHGLLAARPAFGNVGSVYYATDTSAFFIDTGSAWSTQLNTASVATVTGWTLTTPTITGAMTLPRGSAAAVTLAFDAGNGLYSAAADRLNFATAGVVRAEITAIGNMGLGVVPSAWHTDYRAIQVGQRGALWAPFAAGGVSLTDNSFFDGAYKAIQTGAGVLVQSTGVGSLIVYTAPSVSAGATQTFSPRMTLDLAGNVGVGVTPQTWWASRTAVQVGQTAALQGNPAGDAAVLSNNNYVDAAGLNKAIITAAASSVALNSGTIVLQTAPSVAAGATQTYTTRLAIGVLGGVAWEIGAAQSFIWNYSGVQKLGFDGTYFLPADNLCGLGDASHRWVNVYATSGVVSTSSVVEKEHFTRLDPGEALAAVQATDVYAFQYRGQERWQAGFLAEEAHPLLCFDGQTVNPQSTASIALAAIQALSDKVAQLEGRMNTWPR